MGDQESTCLLAEFGGGVAHKGETFAELYNPDPQTYVVDKIGFTMGVLEAGGKLTVYGLKVS